MFRSLRSRLILASLLWTGGLLLVMHVFSILVLHVIPSVRLQHAPLPVAAGLLAMAAGVVALRQSLAPFRRLREKLLCVRGGAGRRIEGQYATEVQPLIDDLNALLEDREKAVQRALRTAADLAHGLKTPLALLAQEADRAAASGFPEMAVSIGQQAERMSRQMNYHLARARAAASGASGRARCQLAPCADALVRTMVKLHAERALTINYTGPPDLVARVQREDLDEILGNLLDNACKWAKAQVVLHAAEKDGVLSILVDDDGPGLAPDEHSAALEPGVRMDEAAPGSGFGLAIVRDLVELYGGSIRLEESSLGGLRARITFPTG